MSNSDMRLYGRNSPTFVPDPILEGLRQYRDNRREPGGFLCAVLENDLVGAFARADSTSRACLNDIIMYLQREVPARCWGSREKVNAHLKGDAT
jgi:hypothetical protein